MSEEQKEGQCNCWVVSKVRLELNWGQAPAPLLSALFLWKGDLQAKDY